MNDITRHIIPTGYPHALDSLFLKKSWNCKLDLVSRSWSCVGSEVV